MPIRKLFSAAVPAFLVLFLMPFASPAVEDAAVLQVRGMKLGKGEAYAQGGMVEFVGAALQDQIVHFADAKRIPLRMEIQYRVLETAPILLNSRYGSEYWNLWNYTRNVTARIHTQEDIDLSKAGDAVAHIAEAWVKEPDTLEKGLAGIRSHNLVLIDQPDREWIDAVRPNVWMQTGEVADELAFTLADLSEYRLEVDGVDSTWEAGAPLRIRFAVIDAAAERFPVINVKGTVRFGEKEILFSTETNELNVPTGWMTCLLPSSVGKELIVRASISAMTPRGPEQREISAGFAAGARMLPKEPKPLGLPSRPADMKTTPSGIPIETRALWIYAGTFNTEESIDKIVSSARDARFNVVIPNIYVSDIFSANSEQLPMGEREIDPLGVMIKKAHAAGLEVHPWFCVSHKIPGSLAWVLDGIEVIDKKGETTPHRVDVHRPEYRDFFVRLVTDVAENYEIDGVHLDYIRTQSDCYCDNCSIEFQAHFGKPIIQATDEEFTAWHSLAINDIVGRVSEGVRAAKPNAAISTAVFADRAGGRRQGQDIVEWARRGWVDMIMPMDYVLDNAAMVRHERMIVQELVGHEDKLVTGLSLYAHHGGRQIVRDPEVVRRQVGMARSIGVSGYNMFDSRRLTPEMVHLFASELNKEVALPHYRYLPFPRRNMTGSPDYSEYELVWADEFDVDGPPSAEDWGEETGFIRNGELQWHQRENAFCKDGFLIMEGRRERKKNPSYNPESTDWREQREYAEYTSPSLNTNGRHSWTYGRFEMRAKIPVKAGLWPVFWTMGVEGEWPSNGEIDIMESYKGRLMAIAAWGTEERYIPERDRAAKVISEEFDADWPNRFHVWRMDWDEEYIRLYVDDELMNEVDLSKTINPTDKRPKNPFKAPHYILLTLAIGGGPAGAPSPTEFPVQYEIDYVRVYQKRDREVQ